MAVLVEATSVIVRRDILDVFYPGGVSAYALDCPNRTYCEDAHLTRVGFMHATQVRSHVSRLEAFGLQTLLDDRFIDLAIVTQDTGPTRSCDWLEFVHVFKLNATFAYLEGKDSNPLVWPGSWSPGATGRIRALNQTDLQQFDLVDVDPSTLTLRDRRTGQAHFMPNPAERS